MRRTRQLFLRSTMDLQRATDQLAPAQRWVVEAPAKVTAHPIVSDQIVRITHRAEGTRLWIPKSYPIGRAPVKGFDHSESDLLTNRVHGWQTVSPAGADIAALGVEILAKANDPDVLVPHDGDYQVLPGKVLPAVLVPLYSQLALWDDSDTAQISVGLVTEYLETDARLKGIRFQHDDGRLCGVTAAECGINR